jgi:hypothetical protein
MPGVKKSYPLVRRTSGSFAQTKKIKARSRWIPAFAGMTSKKSKEKQRKRGASGNTIPAQPSP